MSGATVAGRETPTWRIQASDRAVVHAQEHSYAATRMSALLQAADRAVAALEELLQPPKEARGRVDVYLADPAVGLPTRSTSTDIVSQEQRPSNLDGSAAIVRVMRPEEPGAPLTRDLARVLIPRWFGAGLVAAPRLLDGIAGLVEKRLDGAAATPPADDWVRARLAAGESVSIVAPRPDAADGHDPAADSFVGYLVKQFGADSLRDFLTRYDPARRDEAAIAVYNRPLGALEEAWLAGLRRPPGRIVDLRAFARRLWPLLAPFRLRMAEGLLFTVLNLSYTLALPLATKYVFDTLIPRGDGGDLLLFVVLLFVLYAFNAAVGMRRAYVAGWLAQRVIIDLQERMFAHLQRLSHDFYGRAKIGDVMARLSSDLLAIQAAMTQILGIGLFLALSATAAAITLLRLDLLLGVLVVAFVPAFAAIHFLMRQRVRQASLERQKRNGEVAVAAQENLSAQAVVKAFRLEERAVASYRARLRSLFGATVRLTVLGGLYETSVGLAVALAQVMVLGVGGYLVMEGDVSIGTLAAFIGLLAALLTPVAALSGIGQSVQTATGSIDRISDLLDTPVAITDKPGAVPLPPVSREIRLESVDFGYEPDRPTLRDLSLTIPVGQSVAIVGPSGSGKSTVVNLLMRFYDPDQGRVLMDGHDLRDVTIGSLRDQIGIVFQETFIFDTTLRENIAIGRAGATDVEVAAAAEAAQLDEFVRGLPAGFDTVLGERGVRMSGGQRQRLAIARALLRDPRILILDEATSALDPRTESEIQETLAAAAAGRTTVSITHRLTSAAGADRIFVLDQGRLVEEGAHAELIETDGLYRRLYDEQTGRAVAPAAPAIAVDHLRAVPLLAGLDAVALAAVAARLTRERVAEGAEVVRQGEPGDALYVVARGRLEVLVAGDDGERRVNTLTDGDFFGEMALLSGEPRNATVRAVTGSELFRLGQEDFAILLDQQPAIRALVERTVDMRQEALAAVAGTGSVPGPPTSG